jgi:hypothetical protein
VKTCTSVIADVPWRFLATRLSAALLAVTVIGTVGCSSGGSEPTAPTNDSEGTYALARIDLEAPPVIIHRGPWYDAVSGTFYNLFVVQITGGVIELEARNRFSISITGVVTGDGEGGPQTVTIEGTYEIDVGVIKLTADESVFGASEARIAGDGITLSLDLMGKGAYKAFSFEK